VAEKPNDKLYIQVTESMQTPEIRQRALRPLRMIPDHYEKIVLSLDRSFINSYDGIRSLHLIDWLLK
jgi:predicted AAA+ superfamily ATPase